jgi:hypothetical protein
MTFEQSEPPGLKRKLAHEFKELVYPAKVVDGKILVAFV